MPSPTAQFSLTTPHGTRTVTIAVVLMEGESAPKSTVEQKIAGTTPKLGRVHLERCVYQRETSAV